MVLISITNKNLIGVYKMTRKDYIKIADIIVATKAFHNIDFIISLEDMFLDDNPNFDVERFEKYISHNAQIHKLVVA